MSKSSEILRRVLSEDYKDNPEFLIDTIVRQAERLKELEAENTTLKEELKSLKERVLELERSQHRSVAPFRIEEAKKKTATQRKRPGNKLGHPPSYRQPSGPITEEIKVEIPDSCPKCGSDQIEAVQEIEQIIEELSSLQPRIIRLLNYECLCLECGYVLRTAHPLQISHAQGAAKVHLGPKATALALELEHAYGISRRKSCEMMTKLFQLPISIGGLVQLNHRMAAILGPDYERLIQQIRNSKVVHTDETGWYVGAPGHYLWVFATDQLSLYRIVESRNKAELQNIIDDKFEGILVSDCLNLYDDAANKQQKCYAHHLKAVKNIVNIHPLKGHGYLLKVKELLQQAIKLKRLKSTIDAQEYLSKCEQLEQKADSLFTATPRGDPFEQKINFRIFKQRKHLFTFLYEDDVDATNNLAERQLRPAVIARKISCGNKTTKGANSWQIIHSLVVTHYQNDSSFDDTVYKALKLRLVRR